MKIDKAAIMNEENQPRFGFVILLKLEWSKGNDGNPNWIRN